MSTVPSGGNTSNGNSRPLPYAGNGHGNGNGNGQDESYHRIAMVRRRQGVSLRTVARRWNVEIAHVREQEQAQYDLTLSQLRAWQKVLDVPVQELLVDNDQILSMPVLRRAQLVRLMKTAATLEKSARDDRSRRLASMMIEQLVEVMPELTHVGPWQAP